MANSIKLSAGGFSVPALLLLVKEENGRLCLEGGIVYDGSYTAVKAVVACSDYAVDHAEVDGRKIVFTCDYAYQRDGVEGYFDRIPNGRYENIYCGTFAFPGFRSSYIIGDSEESICRNFYSYLMKTHRLPLKMEWMPYLIKRFSEQEWRMRKCLRFISAVPGLKVSYFGQELEVDKAYGYQVKTDEATLEKFIKEGVESGEIRVTPSGRRMRPLLLTDLDSYTRMHGDAMVKNLEDEVKPLMGLKGGVEEILLKGPKVFWNQQGAVVNAVASAFHKNERKSVILNEGMGCGKSLQALGICETTAALDWLGKNAGKTVRDAYEKDGNICYRTIVMPPGHLVEKWAAEAEQNIVGVKAKVIRELSDLNEVYLRGKERTGKEVYVIGKDLAKLSCSYRPIPSKIRKRGIGVYQCPSCSDTFTPETVKKMKKSRHLCGCGMHPRYFKVIQDRSEMLTGLACERCGSVLYRNVSGYRVALTPSDFSEKKEYNSYCPVCGELQWSPNVATLGDAPDRKNGWHKISHFTNLKKNTRKVAWVLKDHEEEYLLSEGVLEFAEPEDSPEIRCRKWAPAQFIKSKLDGYFDFAIFDELHLYKGAGTAQGNAFHAIAKASGHILGLTGTIAGGYASDLFYTLWRLAPQDMVKAGFKFNGEKDFVEKYGTLETKYSMRDSDSFNRCSKGKAISSPAVKPGISPLIFQDLLIDKTVFLDLTDMSSHLPELHEEVITVPLPGDVESEYNRVIGEIRDACRGNGLSSLSSELLQFSLSYPDKPYGYDPVIEPKTGKKISEPMDMGSRRTYPKEEKLIEIVNGELDEGRNVFIFVEYTGNTCRKVTDRVRSLVSEYCGLGDDEIRIIESDKPCASNREAWIHRQAAAGVRVFICHPKVVETGLDFIFEHEGKVYNYPTLVFYQMDLSLFTVWQASRRAYRLNQTRECRTYYMSYEGTVQTKMVSMMAQKQIATGSIQGHFSMEGLAAMSSSVDPRLVLMNSLLKGESQYGNGDAEKAKNAFSQLHESSELDESIYGTSKTLLYSDVFGTGKPGTAIDESIFELFGDETVEETPVIDTTAVEMEEPAAEQKEEEEAADSFFDDDMFGSLDFMQGTIKAQGEDSSSESARPRKKKSLIGQMSLFDDFD